MVVLNRDFFGDKKDALKEITLCQVPNKVSEIEGEAFYDWINCKYVIIPPSVEKIAQDAFLWDNIRLVISNHPFFKEGAWPFTVVPYINDEISQSLVTMFEKLEAVDNKVDINSEEINKKRDAINKEITAIIEIINKRKEELENKTIEVITIYEDLFKKTDENSEFIKDFKAKITTTLSLETKEKIKNIETAYKKYKSLQESDFESLKKYLEKVKKMIVSVCEEEEPKINGLKDEFDTLSSEIDRKISQMADEVSKLALEELKKVTPYKVINININNIQSGSNKPKILHYQFEDVLKLVAAGFNPLLVGPAGCGKNVIIEQIADALGWKFYYLNDVTEEHKVMGFVDANGHYCKTQFFEACTNGGFIMIDELDQSNASALLAINSAIGTGYHQYASFPDGNFYNMHPDFHIAAAANTYGNGADMRYCGRNQLDSASLNRFIPITINYDYNLESNLVQNQELLPLYWEVRKSVENNRIRQVISTRNIVNADKMLSTHLFDIGKIFDLTLIQGMTKDDLRMILNDYSKLRRYTNIYENRFINYLENEKNISTREYLGR